MSVFIMALTLGYAVTKTNQVIQRANPSINSNSIRNYFDKNSGVNLYRDKQIFAFSAVGTDGVPKYDPRYVRMIARYDTKDEDGNWEFFDMPLHNCTDDDWAQFYDLDTES